MKNDIVNHPAHYTDGKIEVIDYIEDKDFGYHLGNAIKYISRAGKKDPAKKAEDLRKAVWYLERYIEKLEPAQEPKAEPEEPKMSDLVHRPKKKGKAQKEIDDGKIKALRTAGWTITAIADEMKLSAPTVKAHLQKMGGEVMTKPTVFNYADHERALEEIAKLKEDIANLQIRCRIAESEKPDRDCKNCKHNKADGCSRWNCEYEPRDIVERIDFTCDVGETLTLTYALRRLAEDDSMIVGEQYQKAAKKLCDEFRDAFTEEDTGR